MPTLGKQVLDKLRAVDTPTICNVIELFDVRPRNQGYMDARIRACYPELPPIVGFAATATFRSSGPPREGDVYSSTQAQVERFPELAGPPIIVFQDLDDPAVGATFGEQMCRTYQAFGAVGLITSGAGRDLEQVRALRFPVFAAAIICAHAYCHTLQVHVPVHVGGMVVYPSDLLHADANGVTTIPVDIAAEVADAADEFLAAEAVLVDALSHGTPTLEMLDQANREKRAMIAELRQRLSRTG
jgi:4-hydroxy-4-methyl-2-oxoglutarate aldolase